MLLAQPQGFGHAHIPHVILFAYAAHRNSDTSTDTAEDRKISRLNPGPARLKGHHLLLQICKVCQRTFRTDFTVASEMLEEQNVLHLALPNCKIALELRALSPAL